jgi:hypothetical protein
MTRSLSFRAPISHENFLAIGALALIQPLLDKLGVADVIDQHLPPDPQLEFSHGKVLAALLAAARLQEPRALVNIAEWAERTGAEILFGVPSEKLNDDRLGRALDAFFLQRHSIMAGITARALQLTGLDLQRMHFDTTHLIFHGAYQSSQARPLTSCDEFTGRILDFPGNAQLPAVHISKGYLTDRRMIQAGMTAIVDELGALPIFAHAVDGNRTGHIAIRESYELLQRHVPLPSSVLMISDRGTCSAEYLALLQRHGHQALCSVQWKDYRALYNAHETQLQWADAAYLSLEQKRRRASNSSLPLEHYELAVLKHQLVDPRSNEVIPARVIFVKSTSAAREEKQRRLDNSAKIRAGFDNIAARALRGNPNVTYETLSRQIHKLLGLRAAAKYFRWQLVPLTAAELAALPAAGRRPYRQPTHRLEYSCDEAAIAADERHDGISALVTTATILHSADALFSMFKEQNYLERSHHLYKGPIAVTPIFLKSPQRVEALVCLLQLALQAHQVLERLYRSSVPANAAQTEKRLTAEILLDRFSSYCLHVQRSTFGRVVAATIMGSRRRRTLDQLSFPTPAQTLTKLLPPVPESG